MSVRSKRLSKSQAAAALLIFCAGVVFGLVLPKGNSSRTREHSSGQKVVLKLGHSLDTAHPVHLAMEYMNEELIRLSDGTLSLEINAGGVLGNETQMIEQVRNDALGLCKTGLASMNSFVSEMGVFNLPYIFRDADHYWNVLEGPIGKEMMLLGERINIRGLCYYDAGSRNFYSKEAPVLSTADLSSMKIRVQNNQLAKEMISFMGASPETIDWGELYTALQQGVVDGAENNIPSYYSSRHFEVCPQFSMNAHTRVPDMLIISKKKWDMLSPMQRKWLQQAAEASSLYQRKLWSEKSSEVKKIMEAKGVQFHTPDTSSFREAVKPIYKTVEGTAAGDYLRRIQEVE